MNASNNDRQRLEAIEASEGWAVAANQYLAGIWMDYWSVKTLAPGHVLSGRIGIMDVTSLAIVPSIEEDVMVPIMDILADERVLDGARRHLFKRWFMGQGHISDVHKIQLSAKWKDGLENRKGEGEVGEKTTEDNDESTIKQENQSTPINPETKKKDSKEDTRVKTSHEPVTNIAKAKIPTSMSSTGTYDPPTILLSLSLFAQNHSRLPNDVPFTITPSTLKLLRTTGLKYISTSTAITPATKNLLP